MSGASSDDFRMRLSQASSRQLLELVGERAPTLTARDVLRVLRNPYVTGEVIEALLAARSLLASYPVRSAIARHRRTPETVALRFISGLFWRDLLEITVDVKIGPAVRRVAEKYLLERLSRLTVGEKTALARRATAAVLARLRQDPSLRVVKALLKSPRLTEPLLLPMVANESTQPRALDLVASDPRWGARYEVRLALARNPRSPFRVIFEILPTLRRRDLLAVAELDAHSSVVRNRASELLGSAARARMRAADAAG